jgi:hypothetical protein
MENVKACKSCKLQKPLDSFRNRKKSKDGKQYSCKDCQRPEIQKWCNSNRLKKAEYQQNWQKQVKNTSGVSYNTNRRKEDPLFRLANILRVRLNKAIKRNSGISAVRDLGCSIADFKSYIETKFQPNMTWDNYGEWHIDHDIPLCRFDLSDPQQLKLACHYTNLQPLWATDNLRKTR